MVEYYKVIVFVINGLLYKIYGAKMLLKMENNALVLLKCLLI